MPDRDNDHPDIFQLLGNMRHHGASDIHIKVGIPPTYRVGGILRELSCAKMTAEAADHMLGPIIPPGMRHRYDDDGDLDFATYDESGDRFRVNVFRSGGHMSAAIRRVNSEIPTYEALHLPPIYDELVERTHEGLVLVVGVTGSGKSTTLAAMIEHINAIRARHIITLEDPVEFRFTPKKSIISQRELGIDVPDYLHALRYIVRQDPDVIFIGEMRDHDTVLAAIQAAETGHLVFGSMHTADTMQSFSRMLEFFQREEHGFVRGALANTLKAICAQRLLPALEEFETSIVPATEVLLNNAVVKEKIREGLDSDMPAIVGSSREEGMRSFTYSLKKLVEDEWVSKKVAMEFAPNQNALDSALKGVDVKADTLVNRIKSSSN